MGDRIAEYEVIGLLGAGGMGAVYKVRHLISDRIEAIKILLPDLMSTPELAERFMREIRLQASLNHPNIASLHNALRFENQLLMVMEFVDGLTLADIARRGPVRPVQALQEGAQVLAALDYAHGRGVVHRDVKPSNIILDRNGAVKLMDFGIARGTQEFGALTQAGAAIGSMYYMSPEQVRGESVDGRSDVYATAVTLYEIVTGRRPIGGGSASEVLEAHLRTVPANPTELNASIPDDLARALLKGLEKDPAARFASAGAFRDELLRVQANLSSPMETRSLVIPDLAREPERPATPPTFNRTGSQAVNCDPRGLERLRKDLAQHIGPLAKGLVDRAAKRARNWPELYGQLAAEVPAGKERERFLAGCPR